MLVACLVVNPVQSTRDAAGQSQADLRAEARGEMQRVLHWIAAAAAEVQHTEIGVHLLEVGDRWHDAIFQDLDGDHVLDADAHGMAGESLGVGYNDVVGGLTEGVAQGNDLSRRTAAAGGCVRFM